MSKGLYWTLIIIGDLAILASVYIFFNGGEFGDYFWGALCGVCLIGVATIESKKKRINE
ncbi:MAG: hypothetical protein ACE364_00270 [Chlorobiota bacterium]